MERVCPAVVGMQIATNITRKHIRIQWTVNFFFFFDTFQKTTKNSSIIPISITEVH